MTIRKYFGSYKYFAKSYLVLSLFALILLFCISGALFVISYLVGYNINLVALLVSSIIISGFLFFLIYDKAVKSLNFICPNCLNDIRLHKIKDITCPNCGKDKRNFADLIGKCPCGYIFELYECPLCNKEIDLDAEYDYSKLKRMRDEKVSQE